MNKKLWIYASSFFAGVGMCLAGLVTTAQAQWGSNARISMSRGQIGHTIHNPGMSGKKDNQTKLAQSSFSYPQGRDLKVYSGGSEREGWNAKSQSGGEGFWILSKSGNSYAGSRVLSSDIVGRDHDMASMPQAYLGVVEADAWAMAIRAKNGNQASNTNMSTVADQKSNWWPESNGITSPSPNNAIAVNIWNFRYGKYPSSEIYADRIAKGEFPQYNAPAWAEALSEDDFPAVVGIQEGASTKSGLEWTRTWSQSDHPDYDEFFIVDNVVENTSGATVEDIYITFQNRMMSGQATGWRGGGTWNYAHDWAEDDWTRFTLASNYMEGVSRDAFVAGAGKPAGLQRGVDLANNGHAIVYVHDGESDHVTMLVPDVGDQYRYDIAYERYTREQTWVPKV